MLNFLSDVVKDRVWAAALDDAAEFLPKGQEQVCLTFTFNLN